MFRTFLVTLCCVTCSTLALAAPDQEIIDPAEAQADPDFLVQGEYLGQGVWPGGAATPIGAQAIAEGEGKFRVVVYRGGLPGAGWQRENARHMLIGQTEGGVTRLTGKEFPSGRIADGVLTLEGPRGQKPTMLRRHERRSPTLDARPPKGAVVLFDGTSAEHFTEGKLTGMQTLEAGCSLKEKYKIARLHLEFRLSYRPTARGQRRSNSGIFVSGLPEIQILDSFGLEGAKNECGAFYGRRPPDVNMCLPPLVWQTIDVEFLRPKPAADSKPRGMILATVRHNGVVVHENFNTGRKQPPPSGLSLQRHGNRVQYRNIWLVEAR